MVHFIYKLNLFGDKESRKEARKQQPDGGQMMPPPMGESRGDSFAPPMRGSGMGFGGGFGGGFGPL